MYNFGATDSHDKYISLADNANWDAFTTYTMAMWFELLQVSGSASNKVFNKFSANGWSLNCPTTEILTMHHDATNVASTTPFTVDATVHSFIWNWTGAAINFFLDNVADGTPAMVATITGNADTLKIGGDASTNGTACKVGQAAIWRNYSLTTLERTQYHNGGVYPIPNQANLVFWCKGVADPGIDEVSQAACTNTNTVTLTANAVDNYYARNDHGGTFDLAAWLPPLIAAGKLFGGSLLYEPMPKLWAAIQRIKGTTVIGAERDEVERLVVGMRQWRKPRVFYGRSVRCA